MAAALVCAQDEEGGGRGGRGSEGMGGGAARFQRQTRFDIFCDKLKLNGDQKSQVRSLIMEAGQETAPLQQQLLKAREGLAGALIANPGSQMDQLLAQYTPLAVQLAAVEARTFGKICALLKPNQQARAGQAFESYVALYEPSMNRGRRGGR
jgi:hypothetical protein